MKDYDTSPKPLSRTLGSSGKPTSVVSPTEWLRRSTEPVAPSFPLFTPGYPGGRVLNRPGVVQRAKVAVKNKPGETIETDNYKVGDLDIDCIIGGIKYRLAMLEPKDSSTASEDSLLAAGRLPGMTGEILSAPGDIYYVDGKMVADYWETEPEEKDELSTQGMYSGEKGFERIGHPDERSNCAGYALDETKFVEPDDAHGLLKNASLFVPVGLDDMEAGKEYILAFQFHFMKVTKMEDGRYRTREKNGISGVYENTYEKSAFTAKLALYSPYAFYSKIGSTGT